MKALRYESPVTPESIARAKFARDAERERIYQLTGVIVNDNGSVSIYDSSPRNLAVVFGRRAVQRIAEGRPPREAAKIAAHFAEQVLAESVQ
jgi:hypothetical protein